MDYLNYGNNKISLSDLLNNMASQVTSYVNNLPWTSERKNMFMNAYSEILSRGITGADNSTGVWQIKYSGDPIDLSDKSDREKEMYGEAAYFIQQQMLLMKPIEDKDKPVFSNLEFTSQFENYLGLKQFGGRNYNIGGDEDDWNKLDSRNEKGIRSTDVRRRILAKYLQDYADSITEDLYNFEGSPFTDLNDFKTRVSNAVLALNTNTDVENKLNQIGIQASKWFNSGENDTFVDKNGKTWTYKEWNNRPAPEPEVNTYRFRFTPTNLKLNGWNRNQIANLGSTGITLKIQEIFSNPTNIDGDSQSFLRGLGNLIDSRQFPTLELSKEEFDSLKKNRRLQGLTPGRIRKILDGIYYDTATKRWITPETNSYNGDLESFVLNNKLTPLDKAAINMNTPLSLMTEWTPEMKKEIEAIAWDAASILNPEAFSGSAMALNAARLRGEANPNRSTLEKVLDYGTAGLGGIQGFGDLLVTGKLGYRLYQLGKSIGSVSKFVGILGAGFGAIGAYEARDSIAKLATDRDSLTPQDLENIAYGLMGLIGLKSFAKARNKQTIGKQTNPTVTEHNITVKDKNGTHEIKIDETTAKDILLLRTLGKKKATVDSEILNMPKIRESIEKYKESNPTKKLEIEGASIVNNSKVGRNKIVTSKQVKNPEAPKYAPIGTKWYRPFGYMAQGDNKWGYYLGGGWQRKAWENAAPEHSSKGLWQRAKEFWNPEPKPILPETPKPPTTETSTPETPKSKKEYNTPTHSTKVPKSIKEAELEKATLNRLSELESGKISNRKIKVGEQQYGDTKVKVSQTSKGKYILQIGDETPIPSLTQKQLKAKIANFITKLKLQTTGDFTKENIKKLGEYFRNSRKLGWVKQGGKISLEDTISEFLNKLK